LADSLPGVEFIEGALPRHIAQKEHVLQDQLAAELNRRGFENLRERIVVPRDRVDVAVLPSDDLQVLTSNRGEDRRSHPWSGTSS
jgi:hypothetical protein